MEAAVGIELGDIPHHDTAEAWVALRPLDGGIELEARRVAATGAGACGDTEEELHLRVLADRPRPLVPNVKVEGVLRRGPLTEVTSAAPVVVELDHDEVERGSLQRGVVGGIRVHTLRGCRHVELLGAGSNRLGDEIAQICRKGGDVVRRRLKIKIEAIDYSRAEGTVDPSFGVHGTKHVEDELGCRLCGCRGGPASLRIGSTTKRDDDGLSVLVLAGLDIFPITS